MYFSSLAPRDTKPTSSVAALLATENSFNEWICRFATSDPIVAITPRRSISLPSWDWVVWSGIFFGLESVNRILVPQQDVFLQRTSDCQCSYCPKHFLAGPGTVFVKDILSDFQLTNWSLQSNVSFHFSLDFNVKQAPNSSEVIDKTILVENNEISMLDNESTTASPIGQWSDDGQYNDVTLQKVLETRSVVQQLNAELSPLAGRSNYLARTLKLSLRYVNAVDASLENLTNFGQLVELLRKFVSLIDTLRDPSNFGGVRSLEYVLFKLVLEKYDIPNKRQEIGELLERAEQAWQRYQNSQVVLLDNSTWYLRI